MADTGKFDPATFFRHLGKLYDSWKSDRQREWQGADALAVAVGTCSDDTFYYKGVILQSWLFGAELPDSLLLFTDSTLHIFTSPKKAENLKGLERAEGNPAVRVQARSKDEPANAEAMKRLVAAVQTSYSGRKLGTLVKERTHGSGVRVFDPLIKGAGFELTDIAAPLAMLWRVKEAGELQSLREAAMISMRALAKRVVPEMEQALDAGARSRVTNAILSEKAAAALEDPVILKSALLEVVDPCYPAVVQSGGSYDFGSSAQSSREPLHAGVITISLGARYRLICSNVSRTFLVNATKEQEEIYNLVYEAQKKLVEELRPGVRILDAVLLARAIIERSMPQLVPLLPKTFGHGMGMEFKESGMYLTDRNETTIQAGMSFNAQISIANIPLRNPPADPKRATYAVSIADTVVVTEAGPECLTSTSPKQWGEVTYVLDEPVESSKKSSTAVIDDDIDMPDVDVSKPRSTRLRDRELRDNKPKASADTERRKQHQIELGRQKNEEAQARLLNKGGDANGLGARREDELASAISYTGADQMPRIEYGRIHVDMERASVIVPICGLMVPFHARVIKSVSSRDDTLRIVFSTPVQVPGAAAVQGDANKRAFVKELSYRIPNPNKHEPNKHLETTERLIKELRKRLAAQSTESRERQEEEVVPQESLRIVPGARNPKLADVFVQPNLSGGKRTSGQLEAHANGFRFRSYKGATLDVMYKNIKHAFFQPGENELIVLLHFHLKSPILVGKKKVKDVQFYTEVTEVVSNLYERQKYSEQDEIEEEQQERERRKRHNQNYQTFVNQVSELEGFAGLEFDIPYRELGFHGVPFKSNVFLQPTVHCLVNLTETPYFVLTLDDVEVVHFERISNSYNLRNFDAVFVFKDYTRPVVRINTIPIDSLDLIKEWLDSINIKFSEGRLNLNWTFVMNTILSDLPGFFADGGWGFLDPEGSDDEDDDEKAREDEEEGSDYNPNASGSEAAESSDSDFSDATDDDASSGSDPDAGLDDDDEIVGGSDDEDDDDDDDDDDDRPKKRSSDAPKKKN